jgi:glycosyltransferase involved in cell wall biosynthesis
MKIPHKLDIVIPFLNEVESLPKLVKEIYVTFPRLGALGFEPKILLVDDGSTDGTSKLIEKMGIKKLEILKLSQNFGHQNAVWAGIENSRKNSHVIVMDGDGQDPPNELERICSAFNSSNDVVYMFRKSRIDSTLKKFFSKIYYNLLTKLLGSSSHINVGDFYGISPRAKKSLLSHSEGIKYIRGLLTLIGYKQIILEYDRLGRKSGKTKYSLNKMFKLAIDGITGFSIRPLLFVSIASFIGLVFGCFLILYVIYLKLFSSEYLMTGWAFSIILSTLFSISILIILAIISIYMARITQEIKKRPIYIIEENTDNEK